MAIQFNSHPLGDINETLPPGTPYDGSPRRGCSLTVEGGGLTPGAAAFAGSTSARCTHVPAAGKFVGVALYNPDNFYGNLGTAQNTRMDYTGGYLDNMTAELMNGGDIWVVTAASVSVNDPAYVTPAGAWTNVASGNVAVPASFMKTVAGGSVPLRLVR